MRTYAFCSDTRFSEDIKEFIFNPTGLYHEATYTHDMADQAHERYHSTAKEAGMMARMVGTQKLLLGHASSRYKDLSLLEDEARKEFPHAEYVEEGKKYLI